MFFTTPAWFGPPGFGDRSIVGSRRCQVAEELYSVVTAVGRPLPR
jgi:hypothetical protein